MAEVKKLFIDIETFANTAYVWGYWEQDVIQIKQDWFILCYAYKWDNEKVFRSKKLPDYPGYAKDKTNDKKLVQDLLSLLDEADIVVTQNGDKFDLKKINARALVHGLTPPSPYQSIDTKKVVKSIAGFSSNKLSELARQLGFGQKDDTGGFDLWLECLEGNPQAWSKMEKYCKQDVKLLVELYEKIKPWAKTHPNVATIVGEDEICPRCGADALIRRGLGYSGMGQYPRFQCKDCGGWSRGKTQRVVQVK